MRKIVFVLLTVFSIQAFCQEYKIVQHKVEVGETVRMLSQRYHVAPSEIYRINKFAVNGINQGMVLQIPVEEKVSEAKYENPDDASKAEGQEAVIVENADEKLARDNADLVLITHQVEQGETLFSLAKKYSISVEELKKQNEALLKKGLRSGQVLTIRSNN